MIPNWDKIRIDDEEVKNVKSVLILYNGEARVASIIQETKSGKQRELKVELEAISFGA